jgi:hypothetical protein
MVILRNRAKIDEGRLKLNLNFKRLNQGDLSQDI